MDHDGLKETRNRYRQGLKVDLMNNFRRGTIDENGARSKRFAVEIVSGQFTDRLTIWWMLYPWVRDSLPPSIVRYSLDLLGEFQEIERWHAFQSGYFLRTQSRSP